MTGNDIKRLDVLAINVVYAAVMLPVWLSAYLLIWLGNIGEFLFEAVYKNGLVSVVNAYLRLRPTKKDQRNA